MIEFGVSSSVAELRDVLVQRPGPAFFGAFDDPRHGFLHAVDPQTAIAEHQHFVELLESLGPTVHVLEDSKAGPDFLYQYDPTLMTHRGTVLLRSGKPSRRGEEDFQADWYRSNGIPIVGRIEPPGTVDGGDVMWLDTDTVCVGRTLRSNDDGIRQLSSFLDEDVHVFDMPYDAGPDACLHLMSVISPVDVDAVVVELPRLPVGLYQLCLDRGMRLIEVAPDEVTSLGCNVLAIRPGAVVMLEGNPITQGRLEESGVEVHTFEGTEICLNGSGGPTCLTRPVRRG